MSSRVSTRTLLVAKDAITAGKLVGSILRAIFVCTELRGVTSLINGHYIMDSFAITDVRVKSMA